MGVVCRFNPPVMKQPLEVPFEVRDGFNGPHRGTWWYRDRRGHLFGPFWAEAWAQQHLEDNSTVEPFQDDDKGMWWFTDPSGMAHGPYLSLRDADAAIAAFANKDSA